MPDMNFTGIMSPYNTQRPINNPPPSRNFQPTTSHMDTAMPLFSANVMTTTSVPYQSGAFAYDHVSVNPYNMQPNFTMSYSSNLAPAVSYAEPMVSQNLPTVREAQNTFLGERSTLVKSESTSPVQSNTVFNNSHYVTDYKRSNSEPVETTDSTFATDVDTLMKAIQAKQTVSPQRPEVPKVSVFGHVISIAAYSSI